MVLCQTADDGLLLDGDPTAWLLTTPSFSHRIATLAETLPPAYQQAQQQGHLPPGYPLPADERLSDGRWRRFSDYAAFVSAAGQTSLVIGPVGEPEADVRIDCRVERCCIRLELTSEMTDVVVPPGGWRRGQDIALLTRDYQTGMARLLHWCAATHGALTHRGPAFGWCSWYYHANRVTAADVIAITEHACLHDLYMPVIQVDDGF
jgi:hypothetical protein